MRCSNQNPEHASTSSLLGVERGVAIRFSALSLLLGLLFAAPALSQQPITLENSELRVTLMPQNATLLSVEKKASNVSYLGSSKQAGWFRIEIPLSYWEGHAAASNDLQAFAVQKRGPEEVEFQASQLLSKEGQYSISTKLTLRLEGDNLVCRLSLKNQSPYLVDRIIFPIVDVPPASQSSELLILPEAVWPLRMAFSGNDVRTDHNPFDTLDPLGLKAWFFSDPMVSVKAFNYPNSLPTAWFTYTSDGKGIGFDVRAQDFRDQKLVVERRLYRDASSRDANRRDYELSWNWYPVVNGGAAWESPEIYIKFDQGDWHGIAGQHRNWMRSWIHYPDIAKEFQSSLGWISREPRSYEEIPSIAKQGVEVGAPYFIVYSWSQGEPPEMFYGAYPRADLGGIESLQRNLLKARDLGAHPLAWYNGTLTGDTRPDHLLEGKDWAAVDRWGGGIPDGQWSLFSLDQIATLPENEVWLQLDPSGSKERLLETVRRFVEDYHFSGFEMDQAYKFYASYRDPSRIPPELAFAKGYADFYKRAQELVKKHDPEGIIVGEGYSDFQNQYLDSSWVFEGGALDVPQLTRLRYSLPWITVPVRAVVTDLGHANGAFMLNAPLNIFDDLAAHPDYAKHLQQLHRLKTLTSRYFYGGEFSDVESFSMAGTPPKEVMVKSYRDPAGKFLVLVAVNASGKPQEATLRPDATFAAREVRQYNLEGKTETLKPASEIRLDLSAFDVQVLVFETP